MNVLAAAGVEPAFTLTRKDGSRAVNIETQLWRNGETMILALQREPGEAAAERVLLTLRKAARVYDLRAGILRGTAESLELTIDPVVPTLLALSGRSEISSRNRGRAPAWRRRNSEAHLQRLPQGGGSGVAVLRVELVDPRGEVVPGRSANVLLRGVPIAKRLTSRPTIPRENGGSAQRTS